MKSFRAGFEALDEVIIFCSDTLPKSAILYDPVDFSEDFLD